MSVHGAVTTAGPTASQPAYVEITVTSARGRSRVVSALVRGERYSAGLGRLGRGTWRSVARFAGSVRHLPSESPTRTVRVRG